MKELHTYLKLRRRKKTIEASDHWSIFFFSIKLRRLSPFGILIVLIQSQAPLPCSEAVWNVQACLWQWFLREHPQPPHPPSTPRTPCREPALPAHISRARHSGTLCWGGRHCCKSNKHSLDLFLLSCGWLFVVNFCDVGSSKKGQWACLCELRDVGSVAFICLDIYLLLKVMSVFFFL